MGNCSQECCSVPHSSTLSPFLFDQLASDLGNVLLGVLAFSDLGLELGIDTGQLYRASLCTEF